MSLIPARLSHIVLMVNSRLSQILFGYLSSRTPRTLKKPREMSPRLVSASLRQPIPHGISHNYTYVIFSSDYSMSNSLLCLKDRIRDPNPAARATVLAAIRYTFAETSQTFNELLSPLLMDFLSLISDPDLVRKLFTAALAFVLTSFLVDCPTSCVICIELSRSREAVPYCSSSLDNSTQPIQGNTSQP